MSDPTMTVDEIVAALAPLARAAEAAQAMKAHFQNIGKAQQKLAALQGDIQVHADRASAMSRSVRQVEEDLAAKRNALAETERQLAETQRDVATAQSRLNDVRAQIESIKTQIAG